VARVVPISLIGAALLALSMPGETDAAGSDIPFTVRIHRLLNQAQARVVDSQNQTAIAPLHNSPQADIDLAQENLIFNGVPVVGDNPIGVWGPDGEFLGLNGADIVKVDLTFGTKTIIDNQGRPRVMVYVDNGTQLVPLDRLDTKYYPKLKGLLPDEHAELSQTADTQTESTAPVPISYTVQRNDTLSKIAARYNLTVDDVAQANGIDDPNLIHPGQKLQIPSLSKENGC